MNAETIYHLFTYHPPKEDQPNRYERIRAAGKGLAMAIMECCPESSDRNEAIARVRESVMWANASIAVNE